MRYLSIVWNRRRVILATAVVGVAVGYAGTFFLPTLYASQSTLLIMPQRVPERFIRGAITTPTDERVTSLTQQILSRTRLERIIQDFAMYEEERATSEMEDIVLNMRKRIGISPVGDGFRVSFTDANPRTAMRVTERLASLMVEENLRDREVLAEGANQFLGSQIDDVRRQLDKTEKELEFSRRNGGRPTQSMLLDFEVLQATYRSLSAMAQEAKMAANLERRQIGEQFKVIDQARMPEQPVDPGRLRLSLAGGLAGLAFAMAFVSVRTRPGA
jgi:uncharacterized protein involved in exopolysaccharide biosynthesis